MTEIKKTKKKRIVLKLLGFLLLAVILAGCIYAGYVILKAPTLNTLDAEPDGYRTTVLDCHENVVLTLSGQEANRVYVTLDQIPDDLEHAFVAIEDERFYKHHGIDLKGIGRAIFKGITGGGFSQGASTITQQLLKNNVFTDWTSEKTFADKVERKIQEQYLALKLESRVDKDWILENYLNTINLGGGNWGVYTASLYYFGKDVSELNLSECAVLAGITKNPTGYNPLKKPEKNAERRELVLMNMRDQGYISEDEFNEAMADPVYERIAAEGGNRSTGEVFNYFEDALIYDVLDDIMVVTGCTEEEAWNQIYRGGLTIYSTEDATLQAIAEEEVNNPDHGTADAEVSLVLMDNATGQVRAMVGGRGEKTASLIFNRATGAVRQPGSAIKVIGTYAAGFENGNLTLGTVYDDCPYTYSNGTEIHNSDGIYRGRITVEEAIVHSDNVVALKCFQESGIGRVCETLAGFGISTLTDADKVEALALGGTSGGVTNLEMTAAYGALARGGAYIEPVYYTKILDHEGKVLVEKVPESHRAVSTDTALLLTEAMKGVLTEGTAVDAYFDGMNLSGKSGTTTGAKDAWFVGYTPYLTCGVWGGYDDNREQSNNGYVKLIWRSVMARASEGVENKAFSGEDRLTTVTICTKCGKQAIDGLCNASVQGDMTTDMLYLPGTEPTGYCDCHVSVVTCGESGKRAGNYCPAEQLNTAVYLKTATPGTEDEPYAQSGDTSVCDIHKSLLDMFRDWVTPDADNGEEGPPPEDGEDAGSDYGYGYPEGPESSGPPADGPGQEGSGEGGGSFIDEIGRWWENIFF
ncbi:MAG: PBP1A family penicillin-binding protein [Lachnospiraceae bacterium]|nr:PBP1A family penicillin-binding protein [Lachnospiraceae bacterium]